MSKGNGLTASLLALGVALEGGGDLAQDEDGFFLEMVQMTLVHRGQQFFGAGGLLHRP